MLIFAINFLLGIIVFSYKSTLDISYLEFSVFLAIFLLIFATFSRFKVVSINLGFFLLGFAWMGVFSAYVLESRVADEFLYKPINIYGEITSLVEADDKRSKFIFTSKKPFESKLKLSWYAKNTPKLKTGDFYNLVVKLKQNNSFQNSGGFDFEKYLFYEQIDATGYVRNSPDNKFINHNSDLSINSVRTTIRDSLLPLFNKFSFGGVLNALIIGDRSLIDKNNWELFTQTNTTHLSVISGLHIGLISGFVFLFAGFIWRRCSSCIAKVPYQIIGSYFGLASAIIYALIAGLSIPTQRALIMASVVFISLILRRNHSSWQLYGIALIAVLIFNPLSIFSIGFWLSFYVVAVIIYALDRCKGKHWAYQLLYIQLLISIATLPLIAWFFASGSVLSPIANLIAIPVFSFITTPLALIGAIFHAFGFESLSYLSLLIANEALEALSYVLKFISSVSFNTWNYGHNSNLELILLIIAVFLLLIPKDLKLRIVALVLIISVFLNNPNKINNNEFLVTTLDVGQGLAIVVKTKDHALLFDTGASYPSGFNLGNAVVIPYLRSQHINQLDKVIISHGDNDHIGGFKSINDALTINEIITSVPDKIPSSISCNTAQNWSWNDVYFEILHPKDKFTGNNASCVIKVSNNKHSVLLSADIEKKAENHLIATIRDKLSSSVLIVPHHGSKTSSTIDFLQAVNPKHAIVSAGFKNRFNHPASKVVKRYNNLNINLLNTSCSGQIDIYIGNKIRINEYRQDNARYYLRQC